MAEKHIFIVDDEEAAVRSMAFALRRAGYRASGSTSARAALATITELSCGADKVDLLVTDLRMPDMSGMDLIDELARRGVPLRVFVVTGTGGPEVQNELHKRGVSGCLDKPLAPEDLWTSVKKALGGEDECEINSRNICGFNGK